MHKELDSKGRYTSYGVFLEAEENINRRIAGLKGSKVKGVKYYMVSRVMCGYFTEGMKRLVNGFRFELPKGFGTLRAYKTLCTEVNPVTTEFYKDEEGKTRAREFKLDAEKTGGYFFHAKWEGEYQDKLHYKLDMNLPFKRRLYQNALNGFEYPENIK